MKHFLENKKIKISKLIAIFSKKVSREKCFPFKPSIKKNKSLQAIKDIENGVNLSESFKNVAALLEDLNKKFNKSKA